MEWQEGLARPAVRAKVFLLLALETLQASGRIATSATSPAQGAVAAPAGGRPSGDLISVLSKTDAGGKDVLYVAAAQAVDAGDIMLPCLLKGMESIVESSSSNLSILWDFDGQIFRLLPSLNPKGGFLPPFWVCRRTGKEQEANMALSTLDVEIVPTFVMGQERSTGFGEMELIKVQVPGQPFVLKCFRAVVLAFAFVGKGTVCIAFRCFSVIAQRRQDEKQMHANDRALLACSLRFRRRPIARERHALVSNYEKPRPHDFHACLAYGSEDGSVHVVKS